MKTLSSPPLGFSRDRRGFTLIEILLASLAASMILVAIYGIFSRAIKLRDTATQHTRDARLRARATKTVRDDLRNALVSGGLLASTLAGSSTGSDGLSSGGFPGYLKFTTTTGKDGANEFYGDVQQVEYYIVPDPNAAATAADALHAGTLVRAINRDLLASVQQTTREEAILTGVQSLQVSFFDGSTWQTSWQVSGNTTTSGTGSGSSSSSTGGTSSGTTSGTTAPNLPEAIRVEIQQAASSSRGNAPPPLEILVPWTTQPFVPATASASASPSATATPSATPTPPPPPPRPSP